MAKPISLKPRRMTINGSQIAWCLNVPGSLSETGTRERCFFKTQREADAKAEELKTRAHNAKAGLVNLRAPQIVDVNESYSLLAEFPDINLRDAALHYRDLLRMRASSLEFEKLFDSYLALIAGKSDEHRTAMRQTRDRFPSLLEKLVCDITHTELDELLAPLPPASRNLVLRHWRSVFNYGRKKGYLSANPVDRLDFAGTTRKEVEIFEVDAVGKLLGDALANDLELLPFYVFGFFCGIRPEGELEGLDWKYVHWRHKKPEVVIPDTISKVHKLREVPLPPNAIAWLKEYQARGGVTEGKLINWKHENVRKHRLASCERTGVKWIQDGMRHSFASYWLPVHHDKNRLLHIMGHSDSATFAKHYHAGVRSTEAKKFWAIRPPKQKGKIIPFTQGMVAVG